MDCPHCGKGFHDSWNETGIISTDSEHWSAKAAICPACGNPTIELTKLNRRGKTGPETLRVYPSNTFRKPTPKEVPGDIKEDYEEACRVLPISQKASAALSRRCLQAILKGQGYTQKDLAVQIDALLKESDSTKAVPTALRDTVDAIRNFGNFSAHPITDQNTLQIIAVEPHEAEWCLGILEDLFDHYYVKPAAAKARKAALDAKLAKANKPPSK